MTCEELDDLLAAYALDAVDDDERAAIEMHLATCDRHAEAADLRATVVGLAALVEEREPAATLEARLMESVLPAGSFAVLRPRRGLTVGWPAAIAAAIVLTAFGFGAGALLVPGGTDESVVQVAQQGVAWMRAEAVAGEMPMRVTLAGLGRLSDDRGYQVWAVRDQKWMKVGMCNTDAAGWWDGDFDFALESDDALAVTVEPRAGSDRPTGAVVLLTANWERTTEE